MKEKSQKSPDTHKTLEQKIRTFTAICEEDANEAVSLAGKHPNLHDDFNLLVNIMHKAVRKDAKQFMQQLAVLLTENSTELISFFTLIGGAAATVEMYSGQLKIVGVTHLTDKLFSDSGLNITQAEALELIHMIRMFWVDATDASLDFARGLAEAKLFPYLTEDLKNLDKSFSVSLKTHIYIYILFFPLSLFCSHPKNEANVVFNVKRMTTEDREPMGLKVDIAQPRSGLR